MNPETRIAADKTVSDWKELRERLLSGQDREEDWREAYEFLDARIKTRFFLPIEHIIEGDERSGEGHAVMALQCVLIEFLQALYTGQTYRTPLSPEAIDKKAKDLRIGRDIYATHKQPNEYSSSARLFVSFLTTQLPWSSSFRRQDADNFYNHIRCGLLHEAATKKGSLIRHEKNDAPDCLMERTEDGIIVYRTTFWKALKAWLSEYQEKLLMCPELKGHFIRKMDDIAQVSRCFYFAYGSNLKKAHLQDRVAPARIYNSYRARLCDYCFRYNKQSNDLTAKANIVVSPGSVVWGACYELDTQAFEELRRYETGYDTQAMWLCVEDSCKNIKNVEAHTFISSETTDKGPQKEYVELILKGAQEHGLPNEYVTEFLQVSSVT